MHNDSDNPKRHPQFTSMGSLSTLHRRYLTLIEVMIVTVILSVSIGVVGINLAGLARQERFRAATAFLVDRLQLAQDLMIILELDVIVSLQQKSGALELQLQVDTDKLNPLLQKATDTVTIPGIDSFTFTDAKGTVHSEKIDLLFTSRGTRMSEGILALNADQTRYILLAGYPQIIRYDSKIPIKETKASEQLYPIEVIEREQKQNAAK